MEHSSQLELTRGKFKPAHHFRPKLGFTVCTEFWRAEEIQLRKESALKFIKSLGCVEVSSWWSSCGSDTANRCNSQFKFACIQRPSAETSPKCGWRDQDKKSKTYCWTVGGHWQRASKLTRRTASKILEAPRRLRGNSNEGGGVVGDIKLDAELENRYGSSAV